MYISSCQHMHLKFLVLGWPNEKDKFSGMCGLEVLFQAYWRCEYN
jgi:hypothetical protein